MNHQAYTCYFLPRELQLDGFLGDALWEKIPWTQPFVDIRGYMEPLPYFLTQAKMAWSARYFYVAARLEESCVWATLTQKNSVIFHDNDFEVFLDCDNDGQNYYELEINALGTLWELCLPQSYTKGGVPLSPYNISGLITRIGIDGSLNNPKKKDKSWSVEIAFPWKGLAPFRSQKTHLPHEGEHWKVNFSRVQWEHRLSKTGDIERIPPHGTPLPQGENAFHPEKNWVWNPTGKLTIHCPELWGDVYFTQQEA